MAPYDSESDDDDDYLETDVLLGYGTSATEKEEEAGGNETVSRLGGRPDWLVAGEPPSASLARCGVCKALLVLLLQLNGELPEHFPGHERRLYVMACRNKACRRQPGSMRVIRGTRIDTAAAVAEAAAAQKKAEAKAREEAEKAKVAAAKTAAPRGESLFGVASPFGASGSGANPFGASSGANPFSLGGVSGTGGNPFSLAGKAATPAAPAASKAQDRKAEEATTTEAAVAELPKTFAETLSLNADGTPVATQGPVVAPEPWPAVETWPAAYPVSWIADADYETLEPVAAEAMPGVQMEVDDGAASGSGGGKEDKFVFESSMDAQFQRFADRVSQNPEQVIRYEFAGQPLLYSKTDVTGRAFAPAQTGGPGVSTMPSGLPRCPACGARRVFEVQLMPHAIELLEADELSLEGMDWGTVIVAVCEQDCRGRNPAVAESQPVYLEEWVGVQWEELQMKR